jgi:hypothetical protein
MRPLKFLGQPWHALVTGDDRKTAMEVATPPAAPVAVPEARAPGDGGPAVLGGVVTMLLFTASLVTGLRPTGPKR